jgi:hypothetical protein
MQECGERVIAILEARNEEILKLKGESDETTKTK